MSQNNQSYDQTARLAGLVGQIGCVTGFASILIIAAAFGIGRLVDSLLGTDGIFTVLFLLGSFPITLYVIVRISLLALKRVQGAAPVGGASEQEKQTTTEEENTE